VNKFQVGLLTITLAASTAQAAPVFRRPPTAAERAAEKAEQTFLPPNNLHLRDRVENVANVNEEQFHKIIDDVITFFTPVVEAYGVKLEVNKLWDNPTVNASASQDALKKIWYVNMYGGLARRPEVTPDGFALVVCHELGHHLGGVAFKGEMWASSEGQSDYWATQVCARRLWARDSFRNRRARNEVDQPAKVACDMAWGTANERELCYRVTEGGMSLAHLLASLGGQPKPKFETPDPRVVTVTSTAHPQAQCRLDTYFAGALCTKAFDLNKIPGRKHPKGQLSAEAEAETVASSCTTAGGDKIGLRPACWFKSVLN